MNTDFYMWEDSGAGGALTIQNAGVSVSNQFTVTSTVSVVNGADVPLFGNQALTDPTKFNRS